MSINLKYIPCPAGNKCTAFMCIFGHESDKDKQKEKQTPQPSDVTQKSAPSDRTESRKTAADSQPGTAPPQTSKLESSEERSHATATVPATATRPVSPPPLKRPPTKPPSALSATSSPAPARPKRALEGGESSTMSPPAKKRRPESLNPRLLKSAPASHEIRLKLVKLLITEYKRLNKDLQKEKSDDDKRLLLSEQDLIHKVLDEEEKIAIEKPAVYTNIMRNKIMQYKRMPVSQWKAIREQERAAELSKARSQDGMNIPKVVETGLAPAQEVELLQRLLTPITDLAEYNYVPTVPLEEAIKKAREGREAGKGWEQCDRCQKRFQVFPGRRVEDGALTSGGSCRFHWGKTYLPAKAPGDRTKIPKRYRCCNENVGESAGCTEMVNHVYKINDPKTLASILNYVETPDNPAAPKDRAVGFDCEMGYTVHGLELIRLTAVDWPSGNELLDILVRPLGDILDLNSRFSGVWPEDMARAKSWSPTDDLSMLFKSGSEGGSEDGEVRSRKTDLKIVSSPEVARGLLFSLISPETPLIGHGIENDLNAVRIVHPTVIDTVLLFPHKAGLPYRHGLKMLMEQQLNRKIQQETGEKMLGHDSAEDARAAGELVRLRVMQEWTKLKKGGWKSANGALVPPEQW
ncbi:unnamed protein product [Clonostachys byssicola]|uniref:Exonuclease domain-containing protein n=1 Tax=Clonostachys byssicola TaxID=160290 RepID=A0A9N9UJA5_9HYPO|nr:unnamed protein product [Clonostachys byssicola]